MISQIELLTKWLETHPVLKQIIFLSLVILIGLLVYFITNSIILRLLKKAVDKSKNKLDDILFQKKIIGKLALLPPLVITYYLSYLLPPVQTAVQRLTLVLIVWIILMSTKTFLGNLNELYEEKKQFQGRPIKGYIQIVILILYILGLLVIIGILTGQSPMVLLSGVGALTAILILIFRDTILSFVASIHITSNDLIRLGDWIEVQDFGADGDVIDIALHTIKVQNFNKTITVIPTHKMIEKSFKNWRGMTESGGRRIKRSIHIDINTIGLVNEELLARLGKIELLKDYLTQKKEELSLYNSNHKADMNHPVNGRRLTNLGTFRAYVIAYLKENEHIAGNFTFLVRQLPPGPTGLPLEIYVFTKVTGWVDYEAIQSDIFDHLLAVIREFDLKVYQYANQLRTL